MTMALWQVLLVFECIVLIQPGSVLVRADYSAEYVARDWDHDGDIDKDDYLSWEQQRVHMELERVNELPWWYQEEGDSTGSDRMLSAQESQVNVKQPPQSLTSKTSKKQQLKKYNNKHRRARVRSSPSVNNGFCLPGGQMSNPQPTTGVCRARNQRCGNGAGMCCSGFMCKMTMNMGNLCKPLCKSRGQECRMSSVCCSQQCVKCSQQCQGRCGLGEEVPRDNIQAFYYPWYSNIETDGRWRHWAIRAHVDGGLYDPLQNDLPASYFPRLGAYSSSSDETIEKHMYWLDRAGIGTILFSWWGRGSYEDSNVWKVMNAADDWGLKVGFYIEPYGGGYVEPGGSGTRTPFTAKEDIKYIIDTYGCHRAMYRRQGRPVFLFFAARSYANGNQTDWKEAWDELHADPKYNPIVIAHDVNLDSRIIRGGWDGGHDYGTEASEKTSANWPQLAQNYANAGKILYFTVSPGFDNTRLRPPNKPIIPRNDGQLYQKLWLRAIESKLPTSPVVVTSFNELHEGTQIEPCRPMTVPPYTKDGQNRSEYKYEDYDGAWGLTGEMAQFAYLDKTREFSRLFLDK